MSEKKETQEREPEGRMAIRITDMDPKFKYAISKIPGAEKIMLCFQCGTCTADCPIARFSDSYRPRQILRMTQLGLKDRVLSSDVIWLCAACFTCVDHCPQDVEIASVLRALRNLAVKEGYLPAIYRELASNILQTGLAYKIPELRLRRREEIGLPPLPKADLESVNKLADVTGFSKLVQERRT
ncbi:MAG: CoB--CoM heterodisulfide reductase iron-sulfur subunit C [Candidatus Bathyarchaeota archaeon BA1]|nr:MAG: CoB--CoM heterodisulfide reductase iron-sulfur subunit C [Candidatus Bathyarchaeota archaeon BA1]